MSSRDFSNEYEGFRNALKTTLNLRVIGSIPRRLTSFLGTSPEQAPCVPSASACEIDSELIAGRSAQWIHDGLCRVAVDALRQSAGGAQPGIEASSQTPEPHDSYWGVIGE
jgi:hypothetical protein